MFEGYKTLIYFLAGITLASCHCDKVHAVGNCSFIITCMNTISGVQLSKKCLEATNDPVVVQVTLYEAVDTIDNKIDTQFLSTITNLKISAQWNQASLAILQYTNSLRTLHLEGIGLYKITGTPFYYLYHLENLDLSHNKLTEINDMFQFEIHPNKLQNLSLAYNAIEDVPSYAFYNLTSLTELDLSYNIITDLTEEPFSNLISLKVLRLNNNRIKDLNGAVNNLRNLKHLYVRGNQIQNIDDESLDIIEHLETFDVSSNDLEKVKPIMFSRHWNHFRNHSFCKILLSENHIVHIPNGTMKEISARFVRNMDTQSVDIQTELDLSVNSISTIEYNAFQSLIRLVSLNLSKNKIIDFVVNAYDLAHIQYLNLSNNYVSHLYYESFALMNNLQNLDLSYNRLDFIPDTTFYNNYHLKRVNMTFNEIEKLDRIHIKMFDSEGGILDLSNNGLFKLKIPCEEGLHLYNLILHSNNISDPTLIELNHQNDLKNLDMSKNEIFELDASSLRLPVNLVVLDLSCNKIHSVGPSTFNVLKHLKFLRLGNNKLTQLEYGAFQGLIYLEHLDLSFNMIAALDSKFLTDLKHLRTLSLRSNEMNILDYKNWYNHKNELEVYVDNNNFTCDWLGKALNDYNNGFSKMKPTVLVANKAQYSVEGIPCVADSAAYTDISSQSIMADDRLLITSQKILEAVREQNYFLKYFMRVYLKQNVIDKI